MTAPLVLLLTTALLAEPAAAERAAAAAQAAAEAAQKVAEAAATVAAQKAPGWTGTVGLGLISFTGNARSVTFNGTGAAERRSDGWLLGLKGSAVYGQSRVPEGTATQVVAKAAGLQARLDRKFHHRYSGYFLGALEADHVKSVEARYTAEAGASITWVDAAGDEGWKTTLRTDLGFRWSLEERHQFFPVGAPLDPRTLLAPRLGVAFKYALNKDVLFAEDAEIIPNVVGAGRVVVNSTAKLTSRLTRSLAFGASFQLAHDSAPAEGKVSTATILGLTLEVLL